MAVASAGVVVTAPAARAATDPCAAPVNPIVCENSKQGSPRSEWDTVDEGDPNLQGFATDISVNAGQTIQFKIKTDARAYTIDIYRTGWYGGDGARKMASVTPSATLPQSQPACLTDTTVQLVDCGNWSVSASWAVPSTAVSGVYVAHLVRPDTGGDSHIIFVVRNDDSTSKLFFQTSDTTWQAYNTYGGFDFYEGPNGRAQKISYNRPISTRGAVKGRDFYFASEYAMVRFLERNGYDVSYTTGVDSDRRGSLIRNHRTLLSVGHDEYWSGQQRANVEAARDAGVNLAFFSGNEVYWKTRYEASTDSSATAYRTLVCYKETWDNAKTDPTSAWTGTWRDPRFSPPSDGGRPENALTGTAYMVNDADLPVQVPAADGKMRFWRNTSVAQQSAGAVATLAPSTLGYEFDEDLDNGFRPAGLVQLSSTTAAVDQYLQDYGSVTAPGTGHHHMTLYRASSGALVFGAGTIQWAWGLDPAHDGAADGATADTRMQQATVNILADMGAQPATPESGLTVTSASTDTSPPTAVITSPAAGANISNGSAVTVTGTASDAGGGQVGGVEVSLDGGTTWHPATGRATWSYSGSVKGFGSVQIKARAADDSGNLQATPASVTVNASCPCTMFSSTAVPNVIANNDSSGIELGMRFTTDSDGWITGVRFYKASTNTGTHVGSLWSSAGVRLGQVTFSGESSSGWQQANFATPVEVTAGTTYVVSYYAPNGNYSSDRGYFTSAKDVAPLHAPADGAAGPNGMYRYGSSSGFPTSGFQGTNYWVDAVFGTTGPADTTPPTALATSPVAGQTQVDPSLPLQVAFSEPVQSSALTWSVTAGGSAVAGTAGYDATSRTASFTPGSALAADTSYSVTVNGVKDRAGNAIASPVTWTFRTRTATQGAGDCPCTIFGSTAPATLSVSDGSEIELGVRFRASTSGYVAGVRFYKGTSNVGPHSVTLWSGTGGELATTPVYFESASGWQTAWFASPVAVAAGTTYVASYHTITGSYSATMGQFASAVTNGPLTAPADGTDGGNGVYSYGSRAFPSSSYGATGYGVDVVFTTPPDTTPPTVSSSAPGSGATSVPTSVAPAVTFSEPLATGSVTLTLTGPSGAVGGTVALDPTGRVATFTPGAALAAGSSYTLAVTAAKDRAGNSLATAFSATFKTSGATACPCTIFASDALPATADSGDATSLELGTRFTPDTDGWIDAVRFYKGTGNTGTHVGRLWSPTGTLLGSVTFSNETSTGWQTAALTPPVAVTAGGVYTVSYSAPNGHYAVTSAFFASAAWSNAPLSAPAGTNGVFSTVPGTVPVDSYNSSNYWVDASFTTQAPPDTTAPTLTATDPVDGATSVAGNRPLSATFSEPVQSSTISFTLATTSDGTAVSGTTAYDATTGTVTFTPAAALAAGTGYTASVSGAKDTVGNVMSARTWSFTTATAASTSCPCSLWTDSTAPGLAASSDTAEVELGLKWRADVAGTVTGARFYKGSGNTGTHVATLWSSTGTELATATFSGESAAGWQKVTFSQPVTVTANTTYVISYHAPAGHYAADLTYFAAGGVDSGVLHGLKSGVDGPNGVYRYGTRGFPSLGNDANYWVDVVFSPASTAAPTVQTWSPTSGATAVAATSPVRATFAAAVSPTTVVLTLTADGATSPVAGTTAYDSTTRTATFTPSAALAAGTRYTASVTASDTSGHAMTAPATASFTVAGTAATSAAAPTSSAPAATSTTPTPTSTSVPTPTSTTTTATTTGAA